MSWVNSSDYVVRRSKCGNPSNFIVLNRDWWLVKYKDNCDCGQVCLDSISIPARFVGKKIRFKVEVVSK